MNARYWIVTASVFAAAGKVLAGDVGPFIDDNQPVSAQKYSGDKVVDVQYAGIGNSTVAPGSGYTNGFNRAQNQIIGRSNAASVRSREEVHAEAVQAAKDKMITGVRLLPGDDR
jgi:hypothetical protein